MAIKKGDKVKVEYTGTFDDGEVFDSSEGRAPLEFTAGAGEVIRGFDDAVVGMNKGDEKSVRILPKEAYGEHKSELIWTLPRDKLPPGEPKEGMMMAISSSDGRQFPAKVIKVGKDNVQIDLNHPMAGKTLNFKIKAV